MQIKVVTVGATKKVTVSENATVEDAINLSGFQTKGLSTLLNDEKVELSTPLEDGDTISLQKKDSNNG